MTWLKEGDHNTSLFHKVTLGRRRANIITLDIVDLDEDTLFGDLKGFVMKALKVIFDEIRRFMIIGGMHVFPCLGRTKAKTLEISFAEEEIQHELMVQDTWYR